MKYYVPCDALREKPMTLPPKTDATPPASPSRRIFCCTASALLLARGGLLRAAVLAAQVQPGPPATATRPDVAAIDRDRILAAATRYLTQPPTPLTSLQCARSPGSPHDYYSEAGPAALAEGESNAGPSAPAGSGSRLVRVRLRLRARQPNQARRPQLLRPSPRTAMRSSRWDSQFPRWPPRTCSPATSATHSTPRSGCAHGSSIPQPA